MKSQDEERGAALRAEFPYTGVLSNVSRVQNRASQAAIRPHGRAEDQTATASVTTDVDSQESGPGFLYTRFEGQMDGVAVNALTPVGPEQLHFMHRYHARNCCDPAIANAFFDYSVNERNLDESIWSNKICKETPLLAEPEKDLGRYRRWYRQFYSNVEASEAAR